MKKDNRLYSSNSLKTGKLVYRYTSKIIFDDGTEKRVLTFNPFFKKRHFNY